MSEADQEKFVPPDDEAEPVTVRCVEESGKRGVSLLEIEMNGSVSESADLKQALFYLRLQVVGSLLRYSTSKLQRLRVVEFDGSALGRRRRHQVCEDLTSLLRSTAPLRGPDSGGLSASKGSRSPA